VEHSATAEDLVIVGAGGHARELFDTITAVNLVRPRWRVIGFVDPAPTQPDRLDRLGATVVGDDRWLIANPCRYALGIGTPRLRRQLDSKLGQGGLDPESVIHPGAYMGLDIRFAPGVVVYARTTITTNVEIGRHTHVNVGCSIQHDTVIGSFVQIGPGVIVNGDCRIGDDASIGSGAIITRGCSIGAGATVGAGAVVIDDVAPGSTVVGVPARTVSHRSDSR